MNFKNLKVIYRPLWHYIPLLISLTFVISFLVTFIAFNVGLFLLKLTLKEYFSLFWIFTSITWIFLTIYVFTYIWTHYVNVKPSVLKYYKWNDGPWITFFNDPASEIIIHWFTKEKSPSIVEYIKAEEMKNNNNDKNINFKVKRGNFGKKHEVYLRNLEADSKYFYKIKNIPLNSANKNELFYFKTASKQLKPFNFVVFGDTQNGGGFGTPNWAFPKLVSALKNLEYDLILHTGDATDQGNDLKSWHCFFNAISSIAPYHPLYIAVGNHDTGTQYLCDPEGKKFPDEGANFDLFFNYPYEREKLENRITPFKSRYLSFDYSNCRFLILDTQNSKLADPKNPQWKWLVTKLKTTPKSYWKIVIVHRTLIKTNISDGKIEYIPTKYGKFLIPIFEQYGIDMVICGHDHHLKVIEWIPVATKNTNNRFGFLYVVSGGAGNELRRNKPYFQTVTKKDFANHKNHQINFDKANLTKDSTELLHFEDTSHFLFVKVDQNDLWIEARTFKNEVFFRYKIHKHS
ncbi:MAG: metallophosphoesterase [Promethearchaeota archaeon]